MTFPADRLARPDWSCVHFTSAGPSEEELTDRSIGLVRIHAGGIDDDRELLDALAVGFSFPDYFGHNWDALEESLRDLDWLPARGYVLVVEDAEQLWRRAPWIPARLIRSWLFCAESWAQRETPFHLVFEW